MKHIEAIAFDFDMLLVDSNPVHTQARLLAFDHFGLGGVDSSIHEEAHEHGTTPNRIIGWVLQTIGAVDKEADLDTDPFVARVVAKKKEAYHDLAAEGLPPMDGALETITWADEHLGKLAIATTAEFWGEVAPFIRRYNLDGVFQSVVSRSETPEGQTKPHPFVFEEVVRRLGFAENPERVAGVDDHPLGIKSAKTAGLFAVALTTSHGSAQLTEADLVLPGHLEFVDHLRQ